jgi:hypothetical protein
MQNPPSYSVAFDPQAWVQIGQMPHRTFQALQASLNSIAGMMGAEPQASESATLERQLVSEGLAVTYLRDDARRLLTVLEIRPAPARP